MCPIPALLALPVPLRPRPDTRIRPRTLQVICANPYPCWTTGLPFFYTRHHLFFPSRHRELPQHTKAYLSPPLTKPDQAPGRYQIDRRPRLDRHAAPRPHSPGTRFSFEPKPELGHASLP